MFFYKQYRERLAPLPLAVVQAVSVPNRILIFWLEKSAGFVASAFKN